MGTPNYNFTYLEPNGNINLVGDTATFLDEIDSAINDVEVSVADRNELVVIGDSYSDKTQFANNWVAQFESRTGAIVHNYAKSGAGFVHSTGTIFPQQAALAAADSSYDHSKVGRVIVYGGINDISGGESKETVYTNAITTFNTLKNAFANAAIEFYPSWYPSKFTLIAQDYFNRMQLAAGVAGVGFSLDAAWLLWNFKVSNVYQADNVHPNLLGAQIISSFMECPGNNDRCIGPNTILGAHAFKQLEVNTEFNLNAAVSCTEVRGSDYFGYRNGMCLVGKEQTKVTFTTGSENLNQQAILYMELTDDNFIYYSKEFTTPVYMNVTGKHASCLARMVGKRMYLTITPLDGPWSANTTYTCSLGFDGCVYVR